MRKILYTLLFSAVAMAAQAGNPDRQGEAGAPQLLINPWARSAGLGGMTASIVKGVESMHINPAGASRMTGKTDIAVSYTRYLDGADIGVTAFGFSQRMGKSGALTFGVMSMNVGELQVTTEAIPEGTGATFSPTIVNIAGGYSHTFGNKVSVGVMFRGVSEATRDVSAFGVAIDAGVQYVAGKNDNFKLGIALRNVGSRMKFSGEGLSLQSPNPTGDLPYPLTYDKRGQGYDLPSLLSIGASYDVSLGKKNKVSVIGQFTSNSFSRDNIGGGLELTVFDIFVLRGGYRYEVGASPSAIDRPVIAGISGGFSADLPLSKGSKNKLGVDYAYQQTNLWKGNHSLALRIGF